MLFLEVLLEDIRYIFTPVGLTHSVRERVCKMRIINQRSDLSKLEAMDSKSWFIWVRASFPESYAL